MVSAGLKTGILLSVGSVLVVFGAVLVVYWPPIFMTQLQKMLALTPKSMSFEIWREVPIPMYLECFLFNITNVNEILAGEDVLVKVSQMGPYVFREYHKKANVAWNLNHTVTFFNQRTWQFEPEMSNGTLADLVVNINPVIATIGYIMRHQRPILNIAVDSFIRMYHNNLFLTATASEWLFDGIDDRVLDVANEIPFLPIKIPFDKFGWFYQRNGSIDYDGIFVMSTGTDDFSKLGELEKWRNSNRTMYRGECGEVKGSTGELWAPELGQPEVVVFAPDICTYMVMAKTDTVLVEGLEGVQYAHNDSVFDNGYRYNYTACYCDEERNSDCLPSGALNVSACRYGAPAFVTRPHFYNTDPYYPSKIAGLEPTEEHNFRLALEMFTGMPLAVTAQLQINFLVRHIGGLPINNELPDPDTLVPMFWFRQELQVTPEYARLARFALRMRYWVPYALYVLTGIGVALLAWGVVFLTRRVFRSPDTSPILRDSASDETITGQ